MMGSPHPTSLRSATFSRKGRRKMALPSDPTRFKPGT